MDTTLSQGMDQVARSLSAMDVTQAARCKAALTSLSQNAKHYGISEGEILIALGQGRDMLDPFGMFTTFWGRLMKYIGVSFTVALSLLSVLALIDWLVNKVDDVGRWIGKLFSGIPGMFLWRGAKNAIGMDDEDAVYDQDGPISKVAASGLRAFVYGLLPAPVAGVVGAALATITGVTGVVGSHPVATTAGGVVGSAIGLGGGSVLGKVGRGALKYGKKGLSALAKLGKWIIKDEAPDAFSDEELQDIADALDSNPEEVRVLLQDAADADEEGDED